MRATIPTFGRRLFSRLSEARPLGWVLLVALAGARVASAAPQSVSLSVGDYDVDAGETLSIPIVVTQTINISQLAVAKLTLEVGPYLLLPQAAHLGDALTGAPVGALTVDFDTPGRASLSFQTTEPVSFGPGELFVIDFLVHPQAHLGEACDLTLTGVNDNEVILHDTPDAEPLGAKVELDHGTLTVISGQQCARGDVTGDGGIGTGDAIVILRIVTGLESDPSSGMLCSADANLDHEVNTADAIWVLREVVGLPHKQSEPFDAGAVSARLAAAPSGIVLTLTGADGVYGLDVDLAYDPAARWENLASPARGLRLEHEVAPGQRRVRWASGEPLSVDGQLALELPVTGATPVTITRLVAYAADGTATQVPLDAPSAGLVIPARVRVSSYPNPFNPTTKIRFELAQAGPVRLCVYDAAGRRLRTLLEGERPAGPGEVVWNGIDDRGRPVASGVYFARIEGEGQSASHRLVLVK